MHFMNLPTQFPTRFVDKREQKMLNGTTFIEFVKCFNEKKIG